MEFAEHRITAKNSTNTAIPQNNSENTAMPDSLYGARLQGFTVVVFIVAKSRAWFDEYIYHDSLQARAIEGIGHFCIAGGFLDARAKIEAKTSGGTCFRNDRKRL